MAPWGVDMTRYVVRDDLSFCKVDEHFVFLDIDNDRYFSLPHPMEPILASYLEGNRTPDLDISGLIERHILVDQRSAAMGSRRGIKPAARSAMESHIPEKKLRPFDLLEVLAIVLRTRLELKLFTLKHVLDGLCAHGRFPVEQITPLAALSAQRLADAAALFRHARLYVPVDMRCLLDSICMAKFLRRRRLHAHVVFGVALDPFSAHCWVQLDDYVLNDTVGNVHSHTPIRVV
jgi:hypothetical protein